MITSDQLHIVEMLCATADWGFPPETAEAIREVVTDAKRFAAIKAVSHAHAPTMRDGRTSFGVAIPGLYETFDEAVDSLLKGATNEIP